MKALVHLINIYMLFYRNFAALVTVSDFFPPFIYSSLRFCDVTAFALSNSWEKRFAGPLLGIFSRSPTQRLAGCQKDVRQLNAVFWVIPRRNFSAGPL